MISHIIGTILRVIVWFPHLFVQRQANIRSRHEPAKGANMKHVMSLTLATVTALSIAVVPAPASADSDDLVKVLGGLLILGATAKVIDDRRDRRASNQAETERFSGSRSFDRYDGSRIVNGRLSPSNNHKGPKAKRGYKRHALPSRCLRTLETSRRDRSVYGLRCLSRHYRQVSKLPDECAFRVRTNRGVRTVFGARCLRRDGWKVAGRH